MGMWRFGLARPIASRGRYNARTLLKIRPLHSLRNEIAWAGNVRNPTFGDSGDSFAIFVGMTKTNGPMTRSNRHEAGEERDGGGVSAEDTRAEGEAREMMPLEKIDLFIRPASLRTDGDDHAR